MEYVILIIVIAVLALATGGWLLFMRPRRGRTIEAPRSQAPVEPAPGGGGEAETAAAPETPAAAAGRAAARPAAAGWAWRA